MHESAKKLATIAAETQRRENAVRTRGLIGRLLYLNPGLPPGPGQQQIVDHHTTAKPTHADHGIGGVERTILMTTSARHTCSELPRGQGSLARQEANEDARSGIGHFGIVIGRSRYQDRRLLAT